MLAFLAGFVCGVLTTLCALYLLARRMVAGV